MGPFLFMQKNDNGTGRFQKGIINDATNIRRVKHSLTKQKTDFLQHKLFLF